MRRESRPPSSVAEIDRDRHNEVLQQLAEAERRVRQLEMALNSRASELNRLMQGEVTVSERNPTFLTCSAALRFELGIFGEYATFLTTRLAR